MADDGSDPTLQAANDERQQIESLQSDVFLKQEQLERLRQRSHALDEELQLREADLLILKRKLELENHSAKRGANEDKARAESAEDDYLQQQVQRLLQERVPIMSALLEEGVDEAVVANEQAPKQSETAGNKEQEKVHDTVLVSYVESRESWEGKPQDYKVSYRIDGNTTIEQLHRDACAYWGCSRKAYQLWKVNQVNEITCLSGDMSKRLQDQSVLNTSEQAHLHLCNQKRRLEEMIHTARARDRDREVKMKAKQSANNPENNNKPDMLKSLRYGLGLVLEEKQAEEFVDAFAPWPGLQNLLRSRDRAHKTKWQYAHFSDLFCFALLALFTALCFSFRTSSDFFLAREVVLRSLNEGTLGESTRLTQQPFLLYRWPAEPWVDATPGVVWAEGNLRFDGTGLQSVRSQWPLTELAQIVELNATFAPNPNCTEHSVRLASTGNGAPTLHASWDCEVVRLFGAGTLQNTTQACALSEGYALRLEMSLDGSVRFRAGGCEVELAGSFWGVLGAAPLYLTLGADGDNDPGFGMLALAVALPPAEVRSFMEIRLHRHVQAWLGGTFHFQVFDNRSVLRKHYTPQGILRLRQVRSTRRKCERELRTRQASVRPCNYVRAEGTSQQKEELSSDNPNIVEALANLSAPDYGAATRWAESPPGGTSFFGDLQIYSGGGYSLDLPLADLKASGARFLEVLDVLCNTWLSTESRLLALELVLENKAISGYVVANFYLELGPSGAIRPALEVAPFHVNETADDRTANVIDVLRWLLVICYLLMGRVWNEARLQAEQGQSCLAYFLSLGGMLDITCSAFFFAVQAFVFTRRPPSPENITVFQSYTGFANRIDQLVIVEGALFLLLLFRYATFMRFFPEIYRFFKTFSHSFVMFAFFACMAGPIFFGALFFAHAVYGAQSKHFCTWANAASTLILALRESFHFEGMFFAFPGWTLAFTVYFTLAIVIFLMSGFLAIVVHTYFEVELVDQCDPTEERWTRTRWLQWMLWKPVFERLGGFEDLDEAEGEEEEPASSSESDEEQTEQKM